MEEGRQVKPRSIHLQWHLTEACNLRCKHCYCDFDNRDELGTAEVIKILSDFNEQIKKWNLLPSQVRVSFTGGEPLLKKGLFEILEHCQKINNFKYGILTNGMLLNQENLVKLKHLGVGYLQVSLEGMEKANDAIRGAGTFRKIVAAIKLVKQAGIGVSLSMTINKSNVGDVPKMIDLAKDLNVSLGLRRFVPIGSGKEMKKEILSPSETKDLWHYIMERRRDWRLISIGCEDGMLVQALPDYIPEECSAGYSSFAVLPNGDVYPCRRLPIRAGNLKDNSFNEIYYSRIFSDLRNANNVNDVCCNCPLFKRCWGGAKCMAYSYFNDFSAPDPECWRLFSELPDSSLIWKNSNQQREVFIRPKWSIISDS
jgi:radical SAM protein with 4Fe4S-binding SPASM domain